MLSLTLPSPPKKICRPRSHNPFCHYKHKDKNKPVFVIVMPMEYEQ